MIKPKVEFKEKNTDEMKSFIKGMEQIKKAHVTVGFHEDSGQYEDGTTVVEVALWNEFGTRTAPQRSFIRSTLDEQAERINKVREESIQNLIHKKMTVEQALAMIGQNVVFLIQNKIKSNVPPASSQSTKDHKKSEGSPNWNRTLMDTETMLRAVGFKVRL